MKPKEIDPITLTVIWKSVMSIAEELGVTLRNGAFSEAVREGDDFAAAVFDSRARLIGQGDFSPGHLGAMPAVVRNILNVFPAEGLRPGDSFLLNDSALGAGHFPDVFQVMPVFLDKSELIGFVACSAHQVDMGGAAPGSQKVLGVTEAFQEGLRILPIRFVREGVIDTDLLRMILGNVRMPEKVQGDLSAQHSANCMAAVRLEALFRQHSVSYMNAAYEVILNRSESVMRAALARVPAGTYSFEDYLDDYGTGTPSIKVAVDITFDGKGSVEIDFSRSSDTVPAAINSYMNYTKAYAIFAIKVFCDAVQPQNDGNIRPIIVKSREGSFFNPQFPAPSGGRAALQVRIFDAINGALAKAMPEKAMGAFSHWSNPNIGGIDDRTGKQFIFYDIGLGGYGARMGKDGAEALSPVMNCSNIPIEVHEQNNPILVRRLEFIPDSGGSGRWRGGCGIRKDIELLNSAATLSLLGDRHKFAPYGLQGGEEGAKAQTILNPESEAENLGSKEIRQIKRGDIISCRLSGAGGYGHPRERDQQSIAEDIADGYVSEEFARAKYGYASR